MADEKLDAAREEAEAMASQLPGLLEGLAERIGASAGARAVFGDPIKEGGRTIIPVAQSIIGSGGGTGRRADEAAGSGVGVGAGAMTKPLGHLEITADGARFVPLRQPWQDPVLVLAYATIVLIVARALVRLVRG